MPTPKPKQETYEAQTVMISLDVDGEEIYVFIGCRTQELLAAAWKKMTGQELKSTSQHSTLIVDVSGEQCNCDHCGGPIGKKAN